MTRQSATWFDLWTAPFETARTAMAAGETAIRSQAVIAARMPTLLEAWRNPLAADTREIGLMVTEKIGAASRSAKSASAGGARLGAAISAQTAALGRIGSGGVSSPLEWWGIAERGMAIAATMAMLPGEMLAPFHAGVTANARRLGTR